MPRYGFADAGCRFSAKAGVPRESKRPATHDRTRKYCERAALVHLHEDFTSGAVPAVRRLPFAIRKFRRNGFSPFAGANPTGRASQAAAKISQGEFQAAVFGMVV